MEATDLGPEEPIGASASPAPADPTTVNAVGETVPSIDTKTPVVEPGGAPANDDTLGPVEPVTHEDSQLNSFNAYVTTHQDSDPKRRLEVLRYAAAANLDPSVVESQLDELKKTVDTTHLTAQLANAPGLAKFFDDQHNATLAKDDTHNLGPMEWALTGRWEQAPLALLPYHMTQAPAAYTALRDAIHQQQYIHLANMDAAGEPMSDDQRQQLQTLEQEQGQEKDYGADNFFSKNLIEGVKMAPYLAGDILSRGAAGAIAAIPGAAAGPAGAIAGAIGAEGLGSFAWNFYQNYGPQYRKLRQLGASEEGARAGAMAASGLSAALMTGLTGVALKKIPGSIPILQKVLSKVGLDAVSQALVKPSLGRTLAMAPLKLGENVLAGASILAVQAAANAGTEELVKAPSEVEPLRVARAAGDAFEQGLTSMWGIAAVGAGHSLLSDLGQASRLEEAHRQFQATAQAASDSKLLDTSPEHFEEFHRLAQGENAQKRAIPVDRWNEYWQDKNVDPAQMAARVMGDDGKAYADVSTSGGDLSIPAEKFDTNFAKTEHMQGLADDVRFDPDGLTRREAREAMSRQDELRAATQQEAGAAKPEDDGAEAVYQDVYDKAVASGVDKQTAEATSRIWGAAFRNFGRATDMKADEAYRALVDVGIHSGDSTSFDFGANAAPEPPTQEVLDFIGRMKAPDKRDMATEWLKYAQGERSDRPKITPDLEREMAKFGIVDPAGYPYDQNGRDLTRPLKGNKKVSSSYESANAAMLRDYRENSRTGQTLRRLMRKLKQDGLGPVRLEKEGDRGYVTFSPSEGGKPRRFDIHLLENADASTFAHESFHVLSEVLGDVATSENAPEQVKADYQKLLEYMGHASHEERQANSREREQLFQLEERTPEQEARLKQLTAKEERVTHAWEQYLLEGKSPSAELAGPFLRFKRWLTRIYRGASGIAKQFKAAFGEDLNLSDDVRGVFNRLLASQDEIDRAEEAVAAAQPFLNMDKMSPEARAQYERVNQEARAAAEGELHRRIISEERKENKKWFKEERARVQTEVEGELGDNQVYRGLDVLQHGDEAIGNPKLDRSEVAKAFGKEVADTLPRDVYATKDAESKPMDAVAEMLGFPDGETMVRQMAQAAPRKALVDQETQARMEQLYGPSLLDNPQALEREAMDALHTPALVRKSMLELNALKRQLKADEKDRINPERSARKKLEENVKEESAKSRAEAKQEAERRKKLVAELTQPLDREAIRAYAENAVRSRTVDELTGGKYGLALEYQRAERQAAQAALSAAAKGDFERAIPQKERQIINQELYRAAMDLRGDLQKAIKRVKGTGQEPWRQKLGKADPRYRDGHDAILHAVGVDTGPARPEFEPFIQLAKENMDAVVFDVDGIRELLSNPKPWEQLTADQAFNVLTAVTNIRHLANEESNIQLQERKQNFKAYLADVDKAAAAANPPLPPEIYSRTAREKDRGFQARSLVRKVNASLTDIDTWARYIDGNEHSGPFHDLFVRERLKARDNETRLAKSVMEIVRKAWEKTPKELAKLRAQEMPELAKLLPLPPKADRKIAPIWTRDQLWSLFLNSGNEGNRQRIRDGNKWDDASVQQALNMLTKPEADFLQGVLKGIGSLGPELAKAHERRTGLPLEMVQATPIYVNGEKYDGGYFPLKYDKRFGKPGRAQEAASTSDIYPSGWQSVTTTTSATKSRVDTVKSPVDLDWGVIPSHLAQVIHDISYGDWVKDAAKVMMSEEFRRTINTYMGPEYEKQMIPWLRDVANNRINSMAQTAATAGEKFGLIARSRYVSATMGASIQTATQIASDPLSIVPKGVRLDRVLKSYVDVASPLANTSDITDLSKEIDYRDETYANNLREQFRQYSKPGTLGEQIAKTAFYFHQQADAYTSRVIFHAAFTQAMADGKTQEEAVQWADDILRTATPNHDIAQKAPILRTTNGIGAVLMFYGYMNKMYNVSATALADGIPKGAATLLYLAAVQGGAAALLAGRGPKKNENIMEWMAKVMTVETFSKFPLAGGIADAVLNHGDISVRSAPSAEFVTGVIKRVVKLATSQKQTDQQKALLAIETMLALRGLPAAQFHRSTDFLDKMSSNQIRPRGGLDIAGGVAFGARKGQPMNPFTAAQDLISQ